VSVMTTRLASSPVAHAGGKQCEHLTGTQTCYPASTSSGGLRPKPHLEGRKDFRTMSGVLESRARRQRRQPGSAAVVLGSARNRNDHAYRRENGGRTGFRTNPAHRFPTWTVSCR
jgi:hypothetical protein